MKVNFAQSLDRLNMMHSVLQTYDFNNIILESFFTYDWSKIAWGVATRDGFEFADITMHYIGLQVFDFLFTEDVSVGQWIGHHTLIDTAFVFDRAKQIQGYSDLLSEMVDLNEALKIPYFDKLISNLEPCDDIGLTNTITSLVLGEFLKAQASLSIGLKVLFGISENANISDGAISVLAQDYINTIEDGFGISVESAATFLSFRIIQDSILNDDITLSKAMFDMQLSDITDFLGGIN